MYVFFVFLVFIFFIVGSVPEVGTDRYRNSVLLGTAQYRNSVPLGTGTRYNWVPLHSARYHAQYQYSDTARYHVQYQYSVQLGTEGMVRNKDKAASCHRKDPVWKYSTQVDVGGSDKTYVYLKCNYSDKVVKCGVTRMKEHLSGYHMNVAPCSKVPDTIRDEIKSYMNKSTTSKHLAQKQFEDRVDVGSYYRSERSVRDSSSSMKLISSKGAREPMNHYMVDISEDRPPTTQKMAPKNAREARRRVSKDIGRFFYENAIPFNVATSPAYYNMIRSVGAFERGFKPPTIIVDEVGEYLVVQVVTDNASAYKAAGKKLMKKRKHLYWTPCVAHCIDLILEKLGELPQHKHALTKAKKITKFIYNHSWVLALMRKFSKKKILRPAATRFATAYLTLESMLDARQPLEAMFTSTQWLSCAWAKKAKGKEIRKIVLNDRFWQSVLYAITTTRPLVQVLRMVDAEKKPAMGFIYNAMDEAKEMIASNLGGEEESFREIWNIIDDRWELQLHRHLHATGYYLNPQYQYAENKSTNLEIKLGLYHCMDRLISDATERSNADMQLVPFRNKEDFFGLQQAKDTIAKRSPVEWWIQFGDGTPELQRFAMKVLGLTCSSSSCERNWSTYNQIHTKRRNRLLTLRMNSLVYIMYNRRLRDRNLKKKVLMDHADPLLCENGASDDEWFIGDEVEVMSSELQDEDLNVDFFDGLKASTSTTIQEQNKKGKKKITEIEEGVDWEILDSIEEEGERAVHHNDDSNEDPLSDDSADDL
ncbi:hypothetical protein M5K25_021057 [Dendrobium thyrsiflorum]|uniref:BED-type domain-containing protein n=1 Tax=Dendrobium thyrsiflorum TaxID=117978 RepID=A0ABD0UIE6_DENTH